MHTQIEKESVARRINKASTLYTLQQLSTMQICIYTDLGDTLLSPFIVDDRLLVLRLVVGDFDWSEGQCGTTQGQTVQRRVNDFVRPSDEARRGCSGGLQPIFADRLVAVEEAPVSQARRGTHHCGFALVDRCF